MASNTPNVSELTAGYTGAGELKDWSEKIYPPTGPAITKSGSNLWFQDGLQKSNSVDGQQSDSTWFLDGNEESFEPYGGFGSFSSTYYDNGALNQMIFPNSAKLAQHYNSADLATSRVFTNSSGTKLSAWESIVYDENNNRTTETVTQAQPAGASPAVQTGAGSFDYDLLDRLKSFKHPFETTAPVTYGLDDAGNVTSESAPAVTFTFVNNRITGRTPALPALPSSYGYDHFGNQITDTEIPLLPTTTSYNAASQTKRVTAVDGTWVEYGYDGLERMISRTDNTGATVLFFHDGLSDQIALEHDMTKAMVTTRYLVDSFGVARGKLDIDNSTGRSYYMTDPRANVTQMIGASDQAVKAVFAYDPYGKDKATLSKKLTADWDSRLKFQMAPKDPKTGTYNIGSRLMNPTINRFVGSDNYVAAGANLGLQADPLTGNRYLYAGANPAGLIDDGHHPNECPSNGQCVSFDFQPREGQGDVRIGLFIGTKTSAAGFAKGDNRTWTLNTNASNNRVYLDLHLDEGKGFVSAAKSCWSWEKCTAARPWSVNRSSLKGNQIHITQAKDGTTTIRIRSTISLGPGPAIDASFRIDARGNISWARDDYPWLEIYRVKEGKISTVERDNPGLWRTANLFRNTRLEN